jgi:two-component system chemotaxis response regulator CheY
MVKAVLVRARYDVTLCDSGLDALAILEEASSAEDPEQRYVCVITDALMPEMSGYDLVQKIRAEAKFKSLPVIMLTRKRAPEDVKFAVHAGVTDYVVKPIDGHLLLDKVELVLKKNEVHHVYKLPLGGQEAQVGATMNGVLRSISETFFVVRLPLQLPEGFRFESFSSPVFYELGFKRPVLNLVSCEKMQDEPGSSLPPYEAKFAFVGLTENELRKIRAWIQKQGARRLK